MAKKKAEPRKYSREAISNVEKILSYANKVLRSSRHEDHKIACWELFEVDYMHPSMGETRSCFSSTVAIIHKKREADKFINFLKEHMPARLRELQPALHPEDEQDLVLMLEAD